MTSSRDFLRLTPQNGKEKEFSLVRYSLAVSIIVIGGATGVTTWLTLLEVRREMTQNAVEYATEIVNNLFHQVEEEFLLPLLERGETYDHTDAEQVDALAAVVDRAIHAHHVRKLYFFDENGLIIYSTQREHIDHQVPLENELFSRAMQGDVSWALKRRNDPLDLTGDAAHEELLETYVPVYSRASADPERVIGVIEIYQDVETLRSDLRTSRTQIITLALASLGALFVVLFAFILKADRIIRRRRQELVGSNRALRDLSDDLERLVEKRTQQLIDKEKLASLGGLAAGLAHEINTPLATIAACSEGSIARLESLPQKPGTDLEDVRRYLELIHSETFHCKQVIRSLLDYSRQTPVSEKEPIDLNELVEQTIVLVRLRKENRDVDFVVDLRAETEETLGDSAQIRQIVYNLIENATHAVRNTPQPRVELRTFADESSVILECEDNGSGIPEELRENVFNPFFTTKPAREGIGLGLALSYSISQRHGGSLELVRSRCPPATGGPSGSLFRLSLPRTRRHSEARTKSR